MIELENFLLKNFIEQFKNKNMEAFPLIFNEFKDLIDYYSLKIGDEDSYQELSIFFIELLYGINLDKFNNDCKNNLHRYIAVCLRNKYISLSKERQNIQKSFSNLYETQAFYNKDSEDIVLIKEMLERLTPKQRTIIIYKYIYNYHDTEISHMLNISRQSVNRLKNRGIKSLKEFYLL